jgi:alkyl sulfatase BDS1-like metallo-beta-lactamase superfamily hydrolase
VEGFGGLRGVVLGEFEVERGRRELLGGRGFDDHVISTTSETYQTMACRYIKDAR